MPDGRSSYRLAVKKLNSRKKLSVFEKRELIRVVFFFPQIPVICSYRVCREEKKEKSRHSFKPACRT